MRGKELICIVLFTMYVVLLSSQEFSIKKYGVSDDLPHDYVIGTYQDTHGYLWICTAMGLSRFDGTRFVNYSIADGLPSGRVVVVFMDHADRLWVGTRNGVAELRGDRFYPWMRKDVTPVSYVFGITETRDHQLFACTDIGLYMLDDTIWHQVTLPGYPQGPVRGLIESPDGVYLNLGSRIMLVDREWKLQSVSEIAGSPAYYLHFLEVDEALYVTSQSGVFSIEHGQLQRGPTKLNGLEGVYVLLCDQKGRWWKGGADGLALLTNDPDSTVGWRVLLPAESGKFVSSLNEDSEGNLWVAHSNGLFRVSPSVVTTHELPVSTAMDAGVLLKYGSPDLQGIATVTRTDTVLIWTGSTFLKEVFHWSDDRYHELYFQNEDRDEDGRRWFQYWLTGIFFEDNRELTLTYKKVDSETSRDILYDHFRHQLIAAVDSQSLPVRFDGRSWEPWYVSETSPGCRTIYDLHQCANRTILFSTKNGEIYSIDTLDRCRLQLDSYQGNGSLIHFCEDPHEGVWMLVQNLGVERFVWDDGQLVIAESHGKGTGLLNENVQEMVFDSMGNLWVSTPREIVIFKWSANEKKYIRTVAFEASEFGFEVIGRNCLLSDQERVWLGDRKHVFEFNTEQVDMLALAVPDIQIEDILLNQQKVDWSQLADSVSGMFMIPNHPSLSHRQNTLEFFYAGVSINAGKMVEYSYQLSPFQEEWSSPGKNRRVSFVGLPPGDYTFRVRAHAGNEVWSEPAVFSFLIRKPWWETRWFRGVLLCLAISLIVMVFRYRIRQIRNQAEVRDQMRELEQSALRSQMNPHFIHNALNSIQSLILNQAPQEASVYISKFARLMRLTLEASDQKLITLEQELNALKLYIDLERLRLGMDFTYTEKVHHGIIPANVKVPPVIFQPFVENALWHGLASKSGEKRLDLVVFPEQEWLHCVISDNGIGRSAAALRQAFPEGSLSRATMIASQRLEALNGSATPAPVYYEDLKPDGIPSGTRVHLLLRIDRVSSI